MLNLQERNKPQRTLEAEPEESQEESEQGYLDELLVPDPWELNNTARAGIDILFFNRVPKVGSQTFMELLRRLAIRNQFGTYFCAIFLNQFGLKTYSCDMSDETSKVFAACLPDCKRHT